MAFSGASRPACSGASTTRADRRVATGRRRRSLCWGRTTSRVVVILRPDGAAGAHDLGPGARRSGRVRRARLGHRTRRTSRPADRRTGTGGPAAGPGIQDPRSPAGNAGAHALRPGARRCGRARLGRRAPCRRSHAGRRARPIPRPAGSPGGCPAPNCPPRRLARAADRPPPTPVARRTTSTASSAASPPASGAASMTHAGPTTTGRAEGYGPATASPRPATTRVRPDTGRTRPRPRNPCDCRELITIIRE